MIYKKKNLKVSDAWWNHLNSVSHLNEAYLCTVHWVTWSTSSVSDSSYPKPIKPSFYKVLLLGGKVDQDVTSLPSE